MNKLLTWDSSINIGDYVVSTYNRSQLLYKVIKITRRFITKDDIHLYDNVYVNAYKKAKIGDEYNPIVTISPVGNLNFLNKKKISKVNSSLDGSYLIKVTRNVADEWIDKLIKELSVIK